MELPRSVGVSTAAVRSSTPGAAPGLGTDRCGYQRAAFVRLTYARRLLSGLPLALTHRVAQTLSGVGNPIAAAADVAPIGNRSCFSLGRASRMTADAPHVPAA